MSKSKIRIITEILRLEHGRFLGLRAPDPPRLIRTDH
jgi:hypothetical protein